MTRSFPSALKEKFSVFERLTSPAKIQDFLDALRMNFEESHRTCRSPLFVLKHKEAHCMEGAMLAAAALWYHGEPPLVLDLRTVPKDDDHVVTLFRSGGRWGAISKTNHAVLRYRDAVYRDPRELAMSYFNEYFLDDGKKTLRSHSAPFDLRRYGSDWLVARANLWNIPYDLDCTKHFAILGPRGVRDLRPADRIEIEAGKIVEWKRPRRRSGRAK